MAGTTVRLTAETREQLRELARATNQPMQEVLAKVVEAYRRRWILAQSNAAYAELRAIAEGWRQEQEGRLGLGCHPGRRH